MLNQTVLKHASQNVEDAQVKGSSEEEAALRAASDTRGIARKGLLVLALGLGGFCLWAAVAPLDEGVPTAGTVVIDTKRKAVQHLVGGIVDEVLVREGQMVEKDQVLMRLDDAVSRANFESIRQRYLGLSAMQVRLLAEQAGAKTLKFGEDLVSAAAADPFMAAQITNQRQLFQSRRQALAADLAEMDAAMESVVTQRDAAKTMLKQRESQLASLQEELRSLRGLVKDGYAPRNRLLELERTLADVMANKANLDGNILNAVSSTKQLRQRKLARQSEYRKEVETQLADVSREVQADAEKFKVQVADLKRVAIRSPAAGQVVGLAVQTVGAVVQSGQKLMDIVPEQQTLMVEARIAPHLIDKVHSGLVADIRFNTFAHSPQLVVPGEVVSVSGDLLADQGAQSMPYFLARLQVTPEGMKKLGSRQMQAGMPAEVVVKTGSRTMLTYLLSPLLKRMATSLKEE
ncbi:MAG: HlyD family type I secretion periplasmic adaptor subunit [Burkholderiaceae bacterium]|nr:HlyD family type I secretion periplasmic adaptor subunit [Burkholderiaceae bacterium]